MGVFQIKNTISNKIFVGSSEDLDAIWHAQKLQLDVGIHPNSGLQNDWKEDGPVNFIFEILEEIKQKEDKPLENIKDVKALETMIIEELQPFDDRGYNKREKR